MPLDYRERIHEFMRDAQKLIDAGQDALRYLDQDDLQAACDTISLSHYSLSHVRRDYDGILEAFESDGIEPGGGDR